MTPNRPLQAEGLRALGMLCSPSYHMHTEASTHPQSPVTKSKPCSCAGGRDILYVWHRQTYQLPVSCSRLRPTDTHHAHASLTVEGDERGVVGVGVCGTRGAALEVQVDLVGYGVEDRGASDTAYILKHKQKQVFWGEWNVP